MSKKKSNTETNGLAASAVSGRIAGLKISSDSCEFHLKSGKKGARQFTVSGNGGIQLSAVIDLLSAAWAGRRKISVHPAQGEGMESAVASISVGTLPKPAKPAKTAKSGKAQKPADAEPATAVN